MNAWAYVAIGWIGTALAIGGYSAWLVAQRRRMRRALMGRHAR